MRNRVSRALAGALSILTILGGPQAVAPRNLLLVGTPGVAAIAVSIARIPEAHASSTPSSSDGKPGEACTDTCAMYQTGDAALPNFCGTEETNEDYTGCKNLFDQNSAYCQTILLSQQAWDQSLISAIGYTAVAAICTAAAACESGIQAVFCIEYLGAACALGGVGVSGMDIGMSTQLQQTGQAWTDTWVASNVLGGTGGAAALVAGAATAVGGGAANGTAAQQGAGAAKGIGTTSEGNTAAEAVGDVAYWVAAAFYAGTATVKWVNRGTIKNSGDEACNAVIAQSAPGVSYGTTETLPTGSGGDTSTSGTTTTSGSTATDPAVAAESALTAPSTSAAKSGGLGSIPNREKVPDLLKKMGTSVGDLGKRLQSQSPAQALASLSGFGGLTPALNDLDSRYKKLAADSAGAAYASSGRGSLGGTKKDPFGLFGGTSNGIGAGPKDLAFSGEKRAPASLGANGDIWHTGAGATIFEIVTAKYVASRDRIDHLQWASPLNRAMHGLAQIKSAKTGSSGGTLTGATNSTGTTTAASATNGKPNVSAKTGARAPATAAPRPAPAQKLDRKSRTF